MRGHTRELQAKKVPAVPRGRGGGVATIGQCRAQPNKVISENMSDEQPPQNIKDHWRLGTYTSIFLTPERRFEATGVIHVVSVQ